MRTIMVTLALLLLIGGSALLQRYLCQKEEKILSWVLPGFYLLLSLFASIGFFVFVGYMSSELGDNLNSRESIFEGFNTFKRLFGQDIQSVLKGALSIFIGMNIPTVILVSIRRYYLKKSMAE